MKLFAKIVDDLKAVNYFSQKVPSEIFEWVLNTPLDMDKSKTNHYVILIVIDMRRTGDSFEYKLS